MTIAPPRAGDLLVHIGDDHVEAPGTGWTLRASGVFWPGENAEGFQCWTRISDGSEHMPPADLEFEGKEGRRALVFNATSLNLALE